MKILNVGIIGFGLSARVFHTPLLKAHGGFKIKTICSSRTDEVKNILPDAKVVSDPYELISDNKLDLVVNCAPNSFHYTYTAAVLENNKHVVVEKPFVNKHEEGVKLISLAQKNRKVLSVFHNRRWDSDFLTIQRLLAEKKLGEIKQFESHFDRWRPVFRPERWREQNNVGAGMLYDLGAHLIDQALVLFGMPDKLVADIAVQKKNGLADDYFHLLLMYKSTRVILHSTSFTSASPRFQIWGEKANFIKYGLDPQEDQLKEGLDPLSSSYGAEQTEKYGKLMWPTTNTVENYPSEKGNYQQYYNSLYEYIVHDRGDLPVLAKDALNVIQLIELARQSSLLGKAMVL